MEGNVTGTEDKVFCILRQPKDVKYAVLYFYKTWKVFRGEVWSRDRDLEVIFMEVTMMPEVWLRLCL